jgi:hypothetical protein
LISSTGFSTTFGVSTTVSTGCLITCTTGFGCTYSIAWSSTFEADTFKMTIS